ncbi:ABC transporter substrate-binding protein [Methylobacterium sp. Leaf87]|uniref:DUF1007 family protein n=1 Tax=Methylobacterium sp. Leaf87 TaxID=1736243 RepID=UPI0006F9DF91|nr:DUF1007 family protein [Methylobacterium sp. Leaf87]KQO59553.1 ABC transporter substrate-binding protein [Methylobacterium sp. Leaf87]
MPTASLTHLLTGFTALVASLALVPPAEAHPHVWVSTKAEITYGEGGRVTGIRNAWTFDASYSAFVVQGLDANGDGVFSPEELSSLARENTANLVEFGYFTKLKVAGKEQLFADPTEPRMAMEDGKLIMTFLLPLKTPVAPGRGVTALEVYDPTYFVAFGLSDEADAARLTGAPTGCAATVTRPKPEAVKAAEGKTPDGKTPDGRTPDGKTADAKPGLSEAFFEALTASANYGSQFANRIIVACP